MGPSRIDTTRALYAAFADGDREIAERHLGAARADRGRGCNTKVLTFDGDQLVRHEVYFGWNLD